MHLLKSNSKAVATGKKRKKIPIMGTYGQYKESKQKPAPANPMPLQPQISQPKPGQASILNFAGANQGNKDAKMSGK